MSGRYPLSAPPSCSLLGAFFYHKDRTLRLSRHVSGQGLVEYGLLLLLVVIVVASAVALIGKRDSAMFSEVRCNFDRPTTQQNCVSNTGGTSGNSGTSGTNGNGSGNNGNGTGTNGNGGGSGNNGSGNNGNGSGNNGNGTGTNGNGGGNAP
jgi:hypothetical protein